MEVVVKAPIDLKCAVPFVGAYPLGGADRVANSDEAARFLEREKKNAE